MLTSLGRLHTGRRLTPGTRTHTGHGTSMQSHTRRAHETHTRVIELALLEPSCSVVQSHASAALWAIVHASRLSELSQWLQRIFDGYAMRIQPNETNTRDTHALASDCHVAFSCFYDDSPRL